MEAVEDRYERLLDRLMDGGVIPLLGAGISQEARHEDGVDFKPKIKWMTGRLYQRLKEIIEANPNTVNSHKNFKRQLLEDTLLDTTDKNENSELKYKPEGELSFDRLAELFCWLQVQARGQKELCALLKIRECTKLIPTEAHCYLAYLAREGLISEVLTTNYDSCLEKAIDYSFSCQDGKSKSGELYHVITTLEDYRLNGGRRWSVGNAGIKAL